MWYLCSFFILIFNRLIVPTFQTIGRVMGGCLSLFRPKKARRKDDLQFNRNPNIRNQNIRGPQQNKTHKAKREPARVSQSQDEEQDVSDEEMARRMANATQPRASSEKSIRTKSPPPKQNFNHSVYVSPETRNKPLQKPYVPLGSGLQPRNFNGTPSKHARTNDSSLRLLTGETRRENNFDTKNKQQYGFPATHARENSSLGKSYADTLKAPTTSEEYTRDTIPKPFVLKVDTIDDNEHQNDFKKYEGVNSSLIQDGSKNKLQLQSVSCNFENNPKTAEKPMYSSERGNRHSLETSFGADIRTTIGQATYQLSRNPFDQRAATTTENHISLNLYSEYPTIQESQHLSKRSLRKKPTKVPQQHEALSDYTSNSNTIFANISSTDATLMTITNMKYLPDLKRVEAVSSNFCQPVDNYKTENNISKTPLNQESNTPNNQYNTGIPQESKLEQILSNENTIHSTFLKPATKEECTPLDTKHASQNCHDFMKGSYADIEVHNENSNLFKKAENSENFSGEPTSTELNEVVVVKNELGAKALIFEKDALKNSFFFDNRFYEKPVAPSVDNRLKEFRDSLNRDTPSENLNSDQTSRYQSDEGVKKTNNSFDVPEQSSFFASYDSHHNYNAEPQPTIFPNQSQLLLSENQRQREDGVKTQSFSTNKCDKPYISSQDQHSTNLFKSVTGKTDGENFVPDQEKEVLFPDKDSELLVKINKENSVKESDFATENNISSHDKNIIETQGEICDLLENQDVGELSSSIGTQLTVSQNKMEEKKGEMPYLNQHYACDLDEEKNTDNIEKEDKQNNFKNRIERNCDSNQISTMSPANQMPDNIDSSITNSSNLFEPAIDKTEPESESKKEGHDKKNLFPDKHSEMAIKTEKGNSIKESDFAPTIPNPHQYEIPIENKNPDNIEKEETHNNFKNGQERNCNLKQLSTITPISNQIPENIKSQVNSSHNTDHNNINAILDKQSEIKINEENQILKETSIVALDKNMNVDITGEKVPGNYGYRDDFKKDNSSAEIKSNTNILNYMQSNLISDTENNLLQPRDLENFFNVHLDNKEKPNHSENEGIHTEQELSNEINKSFSSKEDLRPDNQTEPAVETNEGTDKQPYFTNKDNTIKSYGDQRQIWNDENPMKERQTGYSLHNNVFPTDNIKQNSPISHVTTEHRSDDSSKNDTPENFINQLNTEQNTNSKLFVDESNVNGNNNCKIERTITVNETLNDTNIADITQARSSSTQENNGETHSSVPLDKENLDFDINERNSDYEDKSFVKQYESNGTNTVTTIKIEENDKELFGFEETVHQDLMSVGLPMDNEEMTEIQSVTTKGDLNVIEQEQQIETKNIEPDEETKGIYKVEDNKDVNQETIAEKIPNIVTNKIDEILLKKEETAEIQTETKYSSQVNTTTTEYVSVNDGTKEEGSFNKQIIYDKGNEVLQINNKGKHDKYKDGKAIKISEVEERENVKYDNIAEETSNNFTNQTDETVLKRTNTNIQKEKESQSVVELPVDKEKTAENQTETKYLSQPNIDIKGYLKEQEALVEEIENTEKLNKVDEKEDVKHEEKSNSNQIQETALEKSDTNIQKSELEKKVEDDTDPEIYQSVIRKMEEIKQKALPFIDEIEKFTELEDSNKYYYIEESLRRLIDKLDDMFDDIGENRFLREERKKVYKFIFPLFDRLDRKVEENKEKWRTKQT